MSVAPALKFLPLVLCLAAAPVARAEEEAPAGEHGKKEDIGAVMLHHVSDGHVLELPGFCPGWSWGCEIELDHVFGTVRDEHTGKAVSGPLVFGALDMTPTKHVMAMWVGSLLLLLVVLGATRKRALVPKGLYNFIEVLVAFVRNEIAVKNIGKEHADRFVPYLTTAFFFILFLNLFGLVPWSATATANLSVTMMLAAFTFIITQAVAIKALGLGGFLMHLTGGVPKSLWPLWAIMIPVEFLSLFTKPFALTVRLFANMVAGHFVILALLGLIFVVSFWVFPASVAMALAIFLLELFVAFVQAYIFTMLSSLFIGAGIEAAAHGAEGHGHAGAEHGEHGSHVAGVSPGHG
jgi:F-type H+-transporting ATPase subunit a